MTNKQIIYEHPVGERIRTFMRLESLFAQSQHFINSPNLWSTQASILALVDILHILERGDMRSEIIKELERNIGILNRLMNTPQVNTDKLNTTLDTLNTHLKCIQTTEGKIGQRIQRQDELLLSICQRSNLCNHNLLLDNPAFFNWLNQPLVNRRQRFHDWLTLLKPIHEAVGTLLDLIRNSAVFETKKSDNGGYQRQLDAQQSFQLIRIALPQPNDAFPEIIGGKHRINVRFLSCKDFNTRPALIVQDIEFELACCGL